MLSMYIINAFLCSLAVAIHYRVFTWLSQLRLHSIKGGTRVVLMVAGALSAHIVEIWLFATATFYLIKYPDFGQLTGNFNNSFNDCLYFSFSTYTSLGIGDIEPLGLIRFLAGIEAITGLVLISWTASFIFWQMQRSWQVH